MTEHRLRGTGAGLSLQDMGESFESPWLFDELKTPWGTALTVQRSDRHLSAPDQDMVDAQRKTPRASLLSVPKPKDGPSRENQRCAARVILSSSSVATVAVPKHSTTWTTASTTSWVEFDAGWGSDLGDGNHVELDICHACLKETLGPWLRPQPRGLPLGRISRARGSRGRQTNQFAAQASTAGLIGPVFPAQPFP